MNSTATTVHGLFYYMLGTSQRFAGFEVPEFILPEQLYLPNCELRNERHFIEFLIRNEWIQRQIMGCDLILSFLRRPKTRNIQGIPVWSFYIEEFGHNWCNLTLQDDINNREYVDIITIKGKNYGNCILCGMPINVKNRKVCHPCTIKTGVNYKGNKYREKQIISETSNYFFPNSYGLDSLSCCFTFISFKISFVVSS